MLPSDLAPRFWARVERRAADECWLWIGAIGTHGYGVVGIGASRTMTTHRVAYLLANGQLPKAAGAHGGVVMHTCDNRRCCNPNHLLGGDQATNLADARAKRRASPPPPIRGEAVHTARLRPEDVRAIRGLLTAGETGASIARRYGVTPSAISDIRSGRAWRHV